MRIDITYTQPFAHGADTMSILCLDKKDGIDYFASRFPNATIEKVEVTDDRF